MASVNIPVAGALAGPIAANVKFISARNWGSPSFAASISGCTAGGLAQPCQNACRGAAKLRILQGADRPRNYRFAQAGYGVDHVLLHVGIGIVDQGNDAARPYPAAPVTLAGSLPPPFESRRRCS